MDVWSWNQSLIGSIRHIDWRGKNQFTIGMTRCNKNSKVQILGKSKPLPIKSQSEMHFWIKHDSALVTALAFALEVVLPGNCKMHPDVTTGWRLLQTPKRYNRNIHNSSFCLTVRSTCERRCTCNKFINLARLGINYNFIFYCVSLVLTWTISDWKPSSFFLQGGVEKTKCFNCIKFWTNVYFMVTSSTISFSMKLQKIMDVHFKYNYF